MVIQLILAPDTEQWLRERATRRGLTLTAYLEELVEDVAREERAATALGSQDLDEFERGLEELAAGLGPLPPLPADFSRADVYGEHS